MRFIFCTLLALLLSLISGLSYADNCVSWRTEFATRNNLRVGNIDVHAENIFDAQKPKENKPIHRLANKVHIQTKASVIRNQLLFSEGEDFNQKKLAETERSLRKQKYIKSASVKPYELCGNHVNIRITTHDNWTLTPGLTFSRQGGESRTGIEIQEHNLLGLGKSLSFKYKKNSKRNSKLFYYKDPHLLGSRNKLAINLQDNTDGKGYGLNLERPFYELDSKSAWGLNTSKLKQATSIYQAGNTIDKITEEKQHHSIFYGWSKQPSKAQHKNKVLRFKVGWTVNKTDFLASTNQLNFQKSSIKESYPWVEFNALKENYITKTNFRSMGKIEDISLGKSLTVGLGLLNKSLGSDDNQLKLSASYKKGYPLGKNNLGFINIQADSYLGAGKRQGETISLQTEIDHFNKSGNDLMLRTKLKVANNLTISEQLVLGGETGLRAYPSAYQTGNKSILIQAEKRFHFDWYPLRLVKFGAVVFADAGTAWGADNKAKVLADIGLGLRLFPTRSSTGKTLHFDIALPLVDRNKVKKYQFSIRTSQSF